MGLSAASKPGEKLLVQCGNNSQFGVLRRRQPIRSGQVPPRRGMPYSRSTTESIFTTLWTSLSSIKNQTLSNDSRGEPLPSTIEPMQVNPRDPSKKQITNEGGRELPPSHPDGFEDDSAQQEDLSNGKDEGGSRQKTLPVDTPQPKLPGVETTTPFSRDKIWEALYRNIGQQPRPSFPRERAMTPIPRNPNQDRNPQGQGSDDSDSAWNRQPANMDSIKGVDSQPSPVDNEQPNKLFGPDISLDYPTGRTEASSNEEERPTVRENEAAITPEHNQISGANTGTEGKADGSIQSVGMASPGHTYEAATTDLKLHKPTGPGRNPLIQTSVSHLDSEQTRQEYTRIAMSEESSDQRDTEWGHVPELRPSHPSEAEDQNISLNQPNTHQESMPDSAGEGSHLQPDHPNSHTFQVSTAVDGQQTSLSGYPGQNSHGEKIGIPDFVMKAGEYDEYLDVLPDSNQDHGPYDYYPASQELEITNSGTVGPGEQEPIVPFNHNKDPSFTENLESAVTAMDSIDSTQDKSIEIHELTHPTESARNEETNRQQFDLSGHQPNHRVSVDTSVDTDYAGRETPNGMPNDGKSGNLQDIHGQSGTSRTSDDLYQNHLEQQVNPLDPRLPPEHLENSGSGSSSSVDNSRNGKIDISEISNHEDFFSQNNPREDNVPRTVNQGNTPSEKIPHAVPENPGTNLELDMLSNVLKAGDDAPPNKAMLDHLLKMLLERQRLPGADKDKQERIASPPTEPPTSTQTIPLVQVVTSSSPVLIPSNTSTPGLNVSLTTQPASYMTCK